MIFKNKQTKKGQELENEKEILEEKIKTWKKDEVITEKYASANSKSKSNEKNKNYKINLLSEDTLDKPKKEKKKLFNKSLISNLLKNQKKAKGSKQKETANFKQDEAKNTKPEKSRNHNIEVTKDVKLGQGNIATKKVTTSKPDFPLINQENDHDQESGEPLSLLQQYNKKIAAIDSRLAKATKELQRISEEAKKDRQQAKLDFLALKKEAQKRNKKQYLDQVQMSKTQQVDLFEMEPDNQDEFAREQAELKMLWLSRAVVLPLINTIKLKKYLYFNRDKNLDNLEKMKISSPFQENIKTFNAFNEQKNMMTIQDLYPYINLLSEQKVEWSIFNLWIASIIFYLTQGKVFIIGDGFFYRQKIGNFQFFVFSNDFRKLNDRDKVFTLADNKFLDQALVIIRRKLEKGGIIKISNNLAMRRERKRLILYHGYGITR